MANSAILPALLLKYPCLADVARLDSTSHRVEVGEIGMIDNYIFLADVVKLVYTYALGAYTARCGGSSPLIGTEGVVSRLKDTNRLIDRANYGVRVAWIAPLHSVGEY